MSCETCSGHLGSDAALLFLEKHVRLNACDVQSFEEFRFYCIVSMALDT